MERREFIGLIGGLVLAWPIAVRAQQGERVRRVGILEGIAEGDPEGCANLASFLQRLQQLGWIDGRNAQFDIRWGAGDAEGDVRRECWTRSKDHPRRPTKVYRIGGWKRLPAVPSFAEKR
jgi:hypothetical protein